MTSDKYLKRLFYVLIFVLGVSFGISLWATVEKQIGENPINQTAQTSSNDKHQEESIWEWARDAAFPDSIAAYTFVLTVATIGLWISTHRLWRAAREAVHVDKRPWLDFTVEIASDFDLNNTKDYPDGMGVFLNVTIRNYGSSPALDVAVSIEGVRFEEYLDWDSFVSKRDKIKSLYEKSDALRRSIFPTNKSKVTERLLLTPEIESEAIQIAKLGEGPNRFSIYNQFIVAVFYRSPTSKVLHETSSPFILMQSVKGGRTAVHFMKGDDFRPIPKSRLSLMDFEQKRAS